MPHITAVYGRGGEVLHMSQGLTHVIGSVTGCLQGILGGLLGKAEISELKHSIFFLGRIQQVFRLGQEEKMCIQLGTRWRQSPKVIFNHTPSLYFNTGGIRFIS